jgi:ubiquinone/menaquinone biosynthesis C-methylase UbiE
VTGDASGWWRGFFDESYLRSYAPKFSDERSRAEGLAAVALAGCGPGARILDAPCGYGRHAIPLAEAGYDVVGLDQSSALLEAARERAGSLDAIELVEGDFRQLPFEDGAFDAVVNLFSSIGFLGDDGDLGVLREFNRVLRPGGRVVVETMHRDRLVSTGLRERDWEPLPDGGVFLEQRRFDPVAGVLEGTHTIIDAGGTRSARDFWLRVYTATELVRLLDGAGFAEIECFGGLEKDPLSAETRLAAVARRPVLTRHEPR